MPARHYAVKEYFALDAGTYEAFIAEPEDAIFLADKCRSRKHQSNWMPPAGSPVPEAIVAGRTNLARKLAIVLTDNPTDSQGAPVDLPRGTPYVSIADDSPDSDMNVRVRAPADRTKLLLIDARQLGL